MTATQPGPHDYDHDPNESQPLDGPGHQPPKEEPKRKRPVELEWQPLEGRPGIEVHRITGRWRTVETPDTGSKK